MPASKPVESVESATPVEPVEIRRNPNNPLQGAYRTGPGVTAGEWFVFHRDHGGGYSDGEHEGVDDWPVSPVG